EQRRTTDPRTILIDLALRALVRSEAPVPGGHREFELIQERFAQICRPRRIIGAVEDSLGEFDIYFNDGLQEYRYDGLSSGARAVMSGWTIGFWTVSLSSFTTWPSKWPRPAAVAASARFGSIC